MGSCLSEAKGARRQTGFALLLAIGAVGCRNGDRHVLVSTHLDKRLVFAGHLIGEDVNTSPDPLDFPTLDGLLKIRPCDSGTRCIACSQGIGFMNERQKAVGSGRRHYETSAVIYICRHFVRSLLPIRKPAARHPSRCAAHFKTVRSL